MNGQGNTAAKQTEDLNNLAKEVDRQLMELEERVVTNLSRYVEE